MELPLPGHSRQELLDVRQHQIAADKGVDMSQSG
jgi:hypothetical protein